MGSFNGTFGMYIFSFHWAFAVDPNKILKNNRIGFSFQSFEGNWQFGFGNHRNTLKTHRKDCQRWGEAQPSTPPPNVQAWILLCCLPVRVSSGSRYHPTRCRLTRFFWVGQAGPRKSWKHPTKHKKNSKSSLNTNKIMRFVGDFWNLGRSPHKERIVLFQTC